jgi:hypothetical protein
MVSAESNTTDRFAESVSREQGSSFTAIFLPTSETETRTSLPSVIEVSAAVGKHPETHRGVGFAGRPEATGLLFGLDSNLLDALLADDQDLFGQTVALPVAHRSPGPVESAQVTGRGVAYDERAAAPAVGAPTDSLGDGAARTVLSLHGLIQPLEVQPIIGNNDGGSMLMAGDSGGCSGGSTPVANDDAYSNPHDRTLTVAAPGVLANDYDPCGRPLTAVLNNTVSHGSLSLSGDGSFVYNPSFHYVGTDTFTYHANNGIQDSNIATVTLTVTNQPPVAVDDSYSVQHGTTLTVSAPGVQSNDYDPDGDPLTSILVSGPQHAQQFSFQSDGSFIYTPVPNYIGPDSFTYKDNDGIVDGNTATVSISVNGIRPLAADDYFETGVDQPLIEPAPGVLYNDTTYGGPLTAVLNSSPTNGSLSLSSDGSFSYTPNPGFSGADSFSYFASDAGLLSTLPALVTIQVVRLDIQMAGVGAGQKLNPGGFVMVNGDNDNGSAVTDGVPAQRDFNVNPLPAGVNDPDLVQVNIVTNPAIGGLRGFFVLLVDNSATGQIRLWNNRNKGAEVTPGIYAAANLPTQFFVEGTEPSAALRENSITLLYFFVDPLRGNIQVGADAVNVTVTPVINNFTIAAGAVGFTVGADGRSGMQATGPGASFTAALNRTGATGNAVYIQNVIGYDNGLGGAAAGWVFTAASGLPNLNTLPVAGTNYPFLDRLAAPPPPDYDVAFVRNVVGNTETITANDSPSTGNPAGSNNLQNIDLRERFTLYLVWRFADNTIYTLATRDWNVVFRADTFVAGRGVTRVLAASAVNVLALNRVHTNPAALRAPIANGNIVIR